MKKVLLIICFLFLITLPGFVFGQSAKEAVRTLKKLEARVQVGISYRDYMPALGDAQFEVNQFLESSEARKKPHLAESINKVMDHYIIAGNLFERNERCLPANIQWIEDHDKFVISEEADKILEKQIPGLKIMVEEEKNRLRKPGLEITGKILENYPETSAFILKTYSKGSCSPGYMDREKAMKLIWQKASDELKKATTMLSQS